MQTTRGQEYEFDFDFDGVNEAFEAYKQSSDKHRLQTLLESVANLLEWDVGRSNKIVELTWECGLVLDKGRALTRAIFLRYVLSMIEHQCILVSVRPARIS